MKPGDTWEIIVRNIRDPPSIPSNTLIVLQYMRMCSGRIACVVNFEVDVALQPRAATG
jgi:hypothetical protein